MKKLLILLFGGLFALLAASCGGGGGSVDISTPPGNPQPNPPPTMSEWDTAEYRRNWANDAVNALYAYEAGFFGQGVTVGISESNTFIQHVDLMRLTLIPLAGRNFHASGSAQLIAGARNDIGSHGIAFESQIVQTHNGNPSIRNPAYQNRELYSASVGDSFSRLTITTLEEARARSYTRRHLTLHINLLTANNAVMVRAAENWGVQTAPFYWNYNATAPLLATVLEKHWINVVALTRPLRSNGFTMTLLSDSNACGISKMFCVAAPGLSHWTPVTTNTTGFINTFSRTSSAAPVVAGVLAVMKSAAPEMPMTEIRKIMLTTATDLGVTGIDDLYGWGMPNLEEAIISITTMKTSQLGGQFAPQSLDSLRASLPAGLSHLRGRLDNVKVAVEVADNYYYNMPLSDIVGAEKQTADVGGLARGMLEGQKPPAENFFGFAAAQKAGNPFFAADGAGFVLDLPGDGFRPFAVIDNASDNMLDAEYHQIGFRWSKRTEEGFGVRAEISRIGERDGFMGSGFGALGESAGTETAQGRLIFGGKLADDWEGFAEYEHARLNAKVSNGGYLQSARGEADGWSAGLQRRNVFLGGDRLRYSVRQKAGLSGGVARFSTPVAEGDARAAFLTGSGQTVVSHETSIDLSARPQIIHGLGYAFYPWSGAEMSFGGEYETETETGALSAALRIDF